MAERVAWALGGEYRIEGLIGRGGMATVFLARERALDREVAIKVLAPHLMRSHGMSARFKREARLAAGLAHRNIIPIFAVREQGELICLIMKRLQGRSLDQLLRALGPLPIPVAQLILHEVAAGLEFAHQRGVVHRDIKPANILVDTEGEVVVTDFGIAKAREADALTASGSTIGTPAYMSPEQAMGKRATAAADQYSLGVVAYELIAGRLPFVAETAMGLMYQHTHTPAEPLETVRPDVPPEVARAVDRMLAKDPAARFAGLPEAMRQLGIPESIGVMDDPVRRELARLVGPPPPVRFLSNPGALRTPTSGRSGALQLTDAEAPTLVIRGGLPRGLLIAGGVALGALATGLVLRDQGPPASQVAAPVPTVPAPRPDTALPPVAARDTTPVVRPPPTTPTRSATRPAAKITLAQAVERYRAAMEADDLARLIAAFPAMGPDQVERYRKFFEESSRIRFEVVIKKVDQGEGEARADLEGFLRYHDIPANEDKVVPYRTRARFVDGPTGWRILEIR